MSSDWFILCIYIYTIFVRTARTTSGGDEKPPKAYCIQLSIRCAFATSTWIDVTHIYIYYRDRDLQCLNCMLQVLGGPWGSSHTGVLGGPPVSSPFLKGDVQRQTHREDDERCDIGFL